MGSDALQVANADPQAPKVTPLDPSSVPKYTMPIETYSSLPNTVLAYKKAHHIGRFDPHGPEMQQKMVQEAWKDIENRSK